MQFNITTQIIDNGPTPINDTTQNNDMTQHGVQEQTLGQKKLSRPLTWWNVISNAFATYSAQKQKNRLGKIAFIA